MSENGNVLQKAKARNLVTSLLKKGLVEVTPVLHNGGVSYADAEEAFNIHDSSIVASTLEKLEREGVLDSQVIDRVLLCPHCDSTKVYTKFTCPKCYSTNVEYSELLEHMKCGFIGAKDGFRSQSSLICPGCKEVLEKGDDHRGDERDTDPQNATENDPQTVYMGVTYRQIGACYQCEKCGYRFDTPRSIYVCQKCHQTFEHNKANYSKVYKYKLKKEAIDEYGKSTPLLDALGKSLIQQGFTVTYNASIRGVSDVQHTFDVLAERDDLTIIIDFSMLGNRNDIISLLGKKIDVNPTEALLIDLSDNPDLLSLGREHGVNVLYVNEENLQGQINGFLQRFNPDSPAA